MKNIYLIFFSLIFILVSCNSNSTKQNYAGADAVYLNLTRIFKLNKDGSIVQTVEKEQKLLTYYAFQSLFGATRIKYNPSFQKIEIGEAFTVTAKGKKLPVPDNGYNEVLPGFCANSKAYNNIREMVVTHTGLERNAVINCAYDIYTKAGIFPFLMGNEILTTNCPVKKLTIVVKIPLGTTLNFQLMNSSVKPDVKEGNDFKTYTWKFLDLPQHNKEIHETLYLGKIPRLLFSTQNSRDSVVNWLTKQSAFSQLADKKMVNYINSAIRDKKTEPEKILEIQRIVVNEINLLQIPALITAFRLRTPEQIWSSNSGTIMEKCCLLVSLLRSIGANAQVCFEIPSVFNNEKLPFLLSAKPFVRVETMGNEPMLLSVNNMNSTSYEFRKFQYYILPLLTGSNNSVLLENDVIEKGEINIDGQLSLKKSGMLTGNFSGKFSKFYNPYLKLTQNPGASKNLFAVLPGTIKRLSPRQSEILYKLNEKNRTKMRGNYCFITLPESSQGVDSKGLNPLPVQRNSILDFGAPLKETYHFSVSVPVNFKLINSCRIEKTIASAGQYSIRIEQTGNEVEIFRQLNIYKPQVKIENYQLFKELINGWYLKKYRQLVFRIEEDKE